MTASTRRRVLVPILIGGAVALVVGAVALGSMLTHSSQPRVDPVQPTAVRLGNVRFVQDSIVHAARRHLPSVGRLKDFKLVDGVARVDPSAIREADGVRVEFTGPRGSEFLIFVGRETDPQNSRTLCPSTGASIPVCTESANAAGHIVDEVRVSRRAPASLGPHVFTSVAEGDAISSADYADLRLEHVVEIHRRDGTKTEVIETVYGPTTIDPKQAFTEPVEALESVSKDPGISWVALGTPAG